MTDVFGQMCLDYFYDELTETPTYHRDDGVTSEAHLAHYFTEYEEWGELDRVPVDAITRVDVETPASVPRTLDLGCGVGRTTRYLQSTGDDVLGFDVSPGALAVARERGVEHVAAMNLFSLATTGSFDAALVVGQQWCAVGTRERFREVVVDTPWTVFDVHRDDGRYVVILQRMPTR